ncbi:nuclear transport factor 2 family protein [Rhodococcus sp. HNM0569]|uniref:nuclear transport factor 2 family protein n=1 Tax=Rhodococcus sp. HNM0569 TaxID=2716340 RepID=UPI00146DE3D3|nr:nuclear transport factor 2 family protein [Rhodococcus sp. HNM0569]NLU82122.1 SnoaL-like domain-containing protein [Rhodococcus sp. HNM0569]
MTVSRDAVRATVEAYVKAVASGTTDDVLALYADGAVVEDPVGSEPRTTRESLREFYAVLEPLEQEGELLTLRIAENTAAFHFRLVTKAGDQRIELSPIDIMEFDDDGKIVSMRAVWSQEDMLAS